MLVFCAGFLALPLYAHAQLPADVQQVVVDLRVPDGMTGSGDIIAGFHTAIELRELHRYRGRLTVIVDDLARRTLASRLGQDPSRLQLPHGIEAVERPSSAHPPVDLYLSISDVGGRLVDWPLSGQAVVLQTRPLFASLPYTSYTEAGFSAPNVSALSFGGAQPTYYRDPAAVRWGTLRNSASRVRDRLRLQIARLPSGQTRQYLESLASATGPLAGTSVGLLYSSHFPYLRGLRGDQYTPYFVNLAARSARTGQPAVLLVPSSRFFDALSNPGVEFRPREEVVIVRRGSSLPTPLASGRVYLVEMDPLPSELFTGVLTYLGHGLRSQAIRIPPLLEGDNAISAALELRIPFSVAPSTHNSRVSHEIGKHFSEPGLTRWFQERDNGVDVTTRLSESLAINEHPEWARAFENPRVERQPIGQRLIDIYRSERTRTPLQSERAAFRARLNQEISKLGGVRWSRNSALNFMGEYFGAHRSGSLEIASEAYHPGLWDEARPLILNRFRTAPVPETIPLGWFEGWITLSDSFSLPEIRTELGRAANESLSRLSAPSADPFDWFKSWYWGSEMLESSQIRSHVDRILSSWVDQGGLETLAEGELA